MNCGVCHQRHSVNKEQLPLNEPLNNILPYAIDKINSFNKYKLARQACDKLEKKLGQLNLTKFSNFGNSYFQPNLFRSNDHSLIDQTQIDFFLIQKEIKQLIDESFEKIFLNLMNLKMKNISLPANNNKFKIQRVAEIQDKLSNWKTNMEAFQLSEKSYDEIIADATKSLTEIDEISTDEMKINVEKCSKLDWNEFFSKMQKIFEYHVNNFEIIK